MNENCTKIYGLGKIAQNFHDYVVLIKFSTRGELYRLLNQSCRSFSSLPGMPLEKLRFDSSISCVDVGMMVPPVISEPTLEYDCGFGYIIEYRVLNIDNSNNEIIPHFLIPHLRHVSILHDDLVPSPVSGIVA